MIKTKLWDVHRADMSTEDVENWMKRDRNRQETERQSQNVKLNKEGQTYMYVTKCDWFYQTFIGMYKNGNHHQL